MSERDVSPPLSRSPGRLITVYLADDHELLRRGLKDLLAEPADFRVVGESGSAKEAARRILALRPTVALLDVRLPDGSGIDVCRTIRERDTTIQVLMITTFDDEDARLAATTAGASGFVLKQIQGDTLIDAIRRVAGGQALPDDEGALPAKPVGAVWSDARCAGLTAQERRIVELLAEGLSNRQLGERLNVTEQTAKNYVSRILRKMGFRRRGQVTAFMAKLDHASPDRS